MATNNRKVREQKRRARIRREKGLSSSLRIYPIEVKVGERIVNTVDRETKKPITVRITYQYNYVIETKNVQLPGCIIKHDNMLFEILGHTGNKHHAKRK